MDKVHIVVVTGLSGSGKSTAIHALEDIGYFCVDNLPIVILDKFLILSQQHDHVKRVALGIDVREKPFLSDFQEVIENIKASGHRVDIVFLEASDEVLIRRFSETRRRHPLELETGSLTKAIEKERNILSSVKEIAKWVIDTSDKTVHQLKTVIQEVFDPHNAVGMTIMLISFGFKYGIPREADYCFDCRFLPNPFFIEKLRTKCGLDKEVKDFLEEKEEFQRLCNLVTEMIAFTAPLHEKEGKVVLTIAFGCTGGIHRSPAVVSEIETRLRSKGFHPKVAHRDLKTA